MAHPFTGLIRDAATGVSLDRDVVHGRPTYRGHKRPGREATNVSIAAEALERLIIEMLFTAVETTTSAYVSEHDATNLRSATTSPASRMICERSPRTSGTDASPRVEWMAAPRASR